MGPIEVDLMIQYTDLFDAVQYFRPYFRMPFFVFPNKLRGRFSAPGAYSISLQEYQKMPGDIRCWWTQIIRSVDF